MSGLATTALAAVTLACALANAAVAAADLARAQFVLANSAEVGVAPRWIPYLAGLKLAGAVGLGLGLAVAPWLGLAAAVGLVGFFVGAVWVHVRTRVFHNIAFPAVFLLLAVGATVHFAGVVA
ncbi:DoxX family protein [Mycobacterium sp. NAZ190054]|uniref:DoxX family protein n=1 Tax=Mycobacterium sp. NAZ190054 TaxID=1747766 RepID=UPI000795FB75|nr:DoxX family protein [Mycobacterium sp. NAZ190054]KWX67142.1 transmembrane invasion protein [Mycobacterium sp. NAZ190054]